MKSPEEIDSICSALNIPALSNIIRDLQSENADLKRQLEEANASIDLQCEEINRISEESEGFRIQMREAQRQLDEQEIVWAGRVNQVRDDCSEKFWKQYEDVQALADALECLMDVQNGPPLITYEKAWNEAMKKAQEVVAQLKKSNE